MTGSFERHHANNEQHHRPGERNLLERVRQRWIEAYSHLPDDQLAVIAQRLDDLARSFGQLSARQEEAARAETRAAADQADALREGLAAIEKQLSRIGREQLKANTLAEAQAERLDAALEALRQAGERRESDLAALRAQNQASLATARLDVVRAILPALDGIDEALRAGERLLELRRGGLAADNTVAAPVASSEPQPVQARWSVGDWLRALFTSPEGARAERVPDTMSAPRSPDDDLLTSVESWLSGLTFVRQRLLNVLEGEGVRPMKAEGSQFDPQLHVALEVVPLQDGLAPGMVAAELHRGYTVHDRVLRHAEVAVGQDER